MDAVFLNLLAVFLLIFQSAILPSFSFFHQSFDLLLIIVLLISISSMHHSMIATIIIMGWIMDSISGVSFFLNTFSYLLVYMIVALTKQMIFKQSIFFIMIISFTAIIIQNALIVSSVFVIQGSEAVLALDYILIIKQAFWGVVIIPPAVLFFQKCQNVWKDMTSAIRQHSMEKFTE